MFDEPKDIFAGTDEPRSESQKIVSPSVITPPPTSLPPSYGTVSADNVSQLPSRQGVGKGKMLMIVLIITIILVLAGFVAYYVMSQPVTQNSVVDAVSDTGVTDAHQSVTTSQDDVIPNNNVPQQEEDQPVTSSPSMTSNPASLLDSDGDGLTNARELEVGTSVTKADTDGDGLGDREEVEVYGTDPRKVDTDGDSYLDGQEVAGGYNPNGPGRLFVVPENL